MAAVNGMYDERRELCYRIMDIYENEEEINFEECNLLKFKCYQLLTENDLMVALDHIIEYSGCPNKNDNIVPYEYYDPTEVRLWCSGIA